MRKMERRRRNMTKKRRKRIMRAGRRKKKKALRGGCDFPANCIFMTYTSAWHNNHDKTDNF
jgi:hypothetical protein